MSVDTSAPKNQGPTISGELRVTHGSVFVSVALVDAAPEDLATLGVWLGAGPRGALVPVVKGGDDAS